jgi:hypothetical protein
LHYCEHWSQWNFISKCNLNILTICSTVLQPCLSSVIIFFFDCFFWSETEPMTHHFLTCFSTHDCTGFLWMFINESLKVFSACIQSSEWFYYANSLSNCTLLCKNDNLRPWNKKIWAGRTFSRYVADCACDSPLYCHCDHRQNVCCLYGVRCWSCQYTKYRMKEILMPLNRRTS